MRKVIQLTFAGEDAQVTLASSADEALTQLDRSKAPIALVDVGLAGSGGYDVCQRIKSRSPATRVLMLSSKQHPYDAGRGATAGADDHLDKPFDTQMLIDKVKALAALPAAPVPVGPRSLKIPPPKPAVPVVELDDRTVEMAPQPPVPVRPQPAAPGRAPPARAPVDDVTLESPKHVPPARVPSQDARASLESKLTELGLNREQIVGVLALSREIVEQVVWEVVPALAETMIREEIARLTRE